jgi:CrcB protein
VDNLPLVLVFGGLGAVARFVLAKWNGYLPWGILLGNTIASAIAGCFGATSLGATLVAGLAGGLSTFSTLIAQTAGLWLKSKARASLNLALNLLIPSTAAYAFGLVSVALLK